MQNIMQNKILKVSLLTVTLYVGAWATLLPLKAIASEEVELRFGMFARTVDVADLEVFVRTGRPTDRLEALLRMAKIEPVKARDMLGTIYPADLIQLDKLLNSPLGEAILDRVALAVHTPSHDASRQALRAAIILSAADNGSLSALELLQRYPTSLVVVDIVELQALLKELEQTLTQSIF